MSATQRIVRVRRQYNQWVADQSLEDYALRFTGYVARRWSHFRVTNTAIGSISFLALEAIGELAVTPHVTRDIDEPPFRVVDVPLDFNQCDGRFCDRTVVVLN